MLKTFAMTDVGRRRKLNQDYIFASAKPQGNMPNLFVVADGMGGHKAGDYASKCTVETIVSEIKNSFEKNPTIIIKKAIKKANECIREKANEDANFAGMGTTVVVATVIGRYLQVANVGDSRLYIIDHEKIRQITKDHSLVEEMIRLGAIERSEARLHPDKNIITRAVGVRDDVEVDIFTVELNPSDTILLCSDGLSNMVEDSSIKEIVNSKTGLGETAEALIEQANVNGGRDNIAVVLIRPFANENIV